MNPVVNRLLAGLVTGVIAPHLQQITGVKLTDGDIEALIALAPLAWHAAAGAWSKACAAFVMYFPPPNPQKPLEPAKVNP